MAQTSGGGESGGTGERTALSGTRWIRSEGLVGTWKLYVGSSSP